MPYFVVYRDRDKKVVDVLDADPGVKVNCTVLTVNDTKPANFNATHFLDPSDDTVKPRVIDPIVNKTAAEKATLRAGRKAAKDAAILARTDAIARIKAATDQTSKDVVTILGL